MSWKRTHPCGVLNGDLVGHKVTLNGWVNRRRDHGGVVFIDLRDRSGLVQIVFSPEVLTAEQYTIAEGLRGEYVVAVTGKVQRRPEGQNNPGLATGEIEVYIESISVLAEAKTPPFPIDKQVDVDESVRLKYRYLDLRRKELQQALIIRHKVVHQVRNFLETKGFLDIETPILTKSTPEGARDYIVPSRIHSEQFYALPQSPQIYKQLLMLAGFERYYQIARCFRDEDLRADRQPEFTQIDLEMSFVEPDDVMELMEEMVLAVFKEHSNKTVTEPILRMTYQEAMSRYGSDRPDMRFGLELVDLSDILKACTFKVFASVLADGGVIRGINVKGCGTSFSRREIDQLVEKVTEYGAKGLVWFNIGETIKSPVAKFLSEEELQSIVQTLEGEVGDLLVVVADKQDVVCDALGRLRLFLGEKLGLMDERALKFLWVTDWPLLLYDEDEGRYVAAHHPFTAPNDQDLGLLETNPAQVRAKAYDLVLNGVELGGGSIRIFERSVQESMFKALGFTMEQAYEKFGFFLEAFDYGAPPHGGIAFGLDRIIMMLTGVKSIRDVIAFPKTASAIDLMVNAPSEVSAKQLRELHIQVKG